MRICMGAGEGICHAMIQQLIKLERDSRIAERAARLRIQGSQSEPLRRVRVA